MKRLKKYSIGCGVVLAALVFYVFAIVASHRDLWIVRIENTSDTKLRLVSLDGDQEVFCGAHSIVNWPDRAYRPTEPPFEAQLPDGRRIQPLDVRMHTPFIFGDAVLMVVY